MKTATFLFLVCLSSFSFAQVSAAPLEVDTVIPATAPEAPASSAVQTAQKLGSLFGNLMRGPTTLAKAFVQGVRSSASAPAAPSASTSTEKVASSSVLPNGPAAIFSSLIKRQASLAPIEDKSMLASR
jgi:hypothetical protein